MDPIFLSRIQFAVTAGFHFLFPPLTLGMTLIIVILETGYLMTGKTIFERLSSFLIKILGLIFVMGVATGIVLEFSFGTNWSAYARTVGDIFGAPLAAEAIFSFFLESVFIAVLLFGRSRVSRTVYWISAILVFLGSHLSALWILMANSWMQTPAGYALVNGKIVLSSFWDASFNPSTLVRFLHVVLASWITGSLFVAAISAWFILKSRELELFKKLFALSLAVFVIAALVQFNSGHLHSVQVARTQPEKMAAFEALWKTTRGAPLAVFGIPVESEQKTYAEISIPKMLSVLVHFDADATIKGLDAFPEQERPPVFLPYVTYHLMVGSGAIFALIAILGIYLAIRKKLFSKRLYLYLIILCMPLPHLANLTGWIAAEVGRQPWAVYRLLKTSQAISPVVPAGQILFSLILFIILYLLLFAAFIIILKKIIQRGPLAHGSAPY